MLALALLVVVAAYVLASLGRTSTMPADIGPFLGVVVGLMVAGHLVIRRLAPEADPVLFPIAAFLNGMGYVIIARLSEDLAGLQAVWTAAGIAAFAAVLFVVRDTRVLERYRYTFMVGGIFLLLMPLLPVIGRNINGARIWVSFGPVNFQPGEFAKIALAIFFASYLFERRELLGMATFRIGPIGVPEPRVLGPVLLAWAASLLVMITERDLGSSLLFFAVFLVLLWIASERLTYLVGGTLLFAAGAFAVWSQFTHVQERVDIWLDPWSEALGKGFQPVQAWYSLAAGGIPGTGLGLGLGNGPRLPAAETDFIFVVIAEELGLIGATAILAAFVLFIGAGLRVALGADRGFDKLLATGLTALVGIQSFIIIAGVIRLLPLTGITLPFVSYGGSSLLANYVLLALLLRISDQSRRRAVRAAST